MKRLWKYIALIALAGLAQPQAQVRLRFTPITQAPPTGDRTLLTQSDFTYAGRFDFASTYGGDTTQANEATAFAFRRVSGNLRFFIATYGGGAYRVQELNTTAFATSGIQTATLNRTWGDIYHGKRTTLTEVGNNGELRGLYWDEARSRLWWSYGHGYSERTSDYTLGYSTLNDANGSSAGFGPWRFNVSYKMVQGGIAPLPEVFRAKYLATGQTMMVGFGGYYSGAGLSKVSAGPAAWAWNPDSLPAATNEISGTTKLVEYEGSAASSAYGPPDRFHRSNDYSTGFDNWAPRGAEGYATWVDEWRQGMTFIDTGTKWGVLTCAEIGTGSVFYENSDRHGANAKHMFGIYNPDHLGQVAQGTRNPDQVQPASIWYPQLAGQSYPLLGFEGGGYFHKMGCIWDETASSFYVIVQGDSIHKWTVN